jgi:hypothetical protein
VARCAHARFGSPAEHSIEMKALGLDAHTQDSARQPSTPSK